MSIQGQPRKVVLKSTEKFPRATVWALRVVALVVVAPVAYGLAHMGFSPLYNQSHNHVKTCTIKSAGIARTGTKSYNHTEYLYIATTDCGYLRFRGSKQGLTQDEFISRINSYKGQKLDLAFGDWQLFLSDPEVCAVDFGD